VKVTIGLPVYNAMPFLRDALRSIFAQSFTDWELIIVDDGSTDGSLEVARAVCDPRVTVYSDGVNRGLVHRLNQIAQLAQGYYLARMDADDLMHPERLAKQVRFLDDHPDVDVVDTGLFSMSINAITTGVRGQEPLQPSLAAALDHALLRHATILGRPQWFRKNPYSPLYQRAEDRELWCRTVNHSTFARIQEPLYFYRELVNLRNYLSSGHHNRMFIRKYGPDAIGSYRTIGLITKSYLKCAVYCVFTVLRIEKILVALRNRRLDPAEVAAADEVIQRILRTSVPGLDSPVTSTVSSRELAA